MTGVHMYSPRHRKPGDRITFPVRYGRWTIEGMRYDYRSLRRQGISAAEARGVLVRQMIRCGAPSFEVET